MVPTEYSIQIYIDFNVKLIIVYPYKVLEKFVNRSVKINDTAKNINKLCYMYYIVPI